MAIPSEMTVSVSKGKPSESSDEHNDRKTNLEKASEKKKDAFYTKTGHKHIHREYTYLNSDLLIRKPSEVYDEIFEDSIKEYNDSKTRSDRKIGKGKALTRAEKTAQLQAWTMVHDMRKLSKKNQKLALAKFAKSYPMASKALQDLVERTDGMTLKDIRKQVTRAKHAKTLGEAYYDKQKHSKQQRTAVEFVIQVGSAEDFNEIDKNGRIVKSYDRTNPNGIWQRSKKVLKDYYKEFTKNNPNLVPINASIHMDESTPHLHLKVIPVADRDQMQMRGHGTVDKKTGKIAKKARHTGLSKKVSFNGALECEGFKRDSRDNRAQFKNWQNREADSLTKIMQQELGVERKKGITNKLKDVHEYKKAMQDVAKQREKAQNMKAIADENAILATQNYDIYQKNSKAVKAEQDKLDKLKQDTVEAQKTLSNMSKEKQRQLDALSQEMAQKRSKRLRELSRELDEKRQKEETKLQAREDAVSKREVNVKNREVDVHAMQFGGYDSKGIKHKSIKERIEEGIENGIRKVQKTLLHPIKAFTFAYRKSMVKQLHPNYTKEQVKKLTDIQESYLESQAGGASARILRELASDKYEHKSVKAIGAGTKALVKALPSYQAVDEAINDAILLDQLENEEKQHKQEQKLQDQPKQTPTVSKDKDEEDSPDFYDTF